jgi:hypothetical protein
VYVPVETIAPGLHAPADASLSGSEKLRGPQSLAGGETYQVWHKTDTDGGLQGSILLIVKEKAVWLVDPGINGVHKKRPDGTEVPKFEAPKSDPHETTSSKVFLTVNCLGAWSFLE